jgi:choline dehydrogenase-like flavoprotein
MVVGVSTEQVPSHGCSDGEEVDVLVVGYGAAGAAAALSAHEAGARVLVVEKCPQPGGNSLVSSANTVYPQDPADVARFTRYLIEVCEGTTPGDVIETYVRGLLEIPDWLAAMGGELEDLDDLPMGSYYIPNLTFRSCPVPKVCAWCCAGSSRPHVARSRPAVHVCGICLITGSALGASRYGAPLRCATWSLTGPGGSAAWW